MKKIVLGLLCVLSLGAVEVDTPMSAKEILIKQTSEMNKTLPRMINTHYRYDKVEVDRNSLINIFTLVGMTTREINLAYFKEVMEQDLKESLCKNSDIKETFMSGVKLMCVFVGKDRKRVIEFIYDAQECTLKKDKLDWNGYYNFSI